MSTNHIFVICLDNPDLVLNNFQWLICHKTKLNKKLPRSSELESLYHAVECHSQNPSYVGVFSAGYTVNIF